MILLSIIACGTLLFINLFEEYPKEDKECHIKLLREL